MILFLVYGLVPVVFGIAFIPFISTNSNYGMFEYGEKLKPGNKDALLKKHFRYFYDIIFLR